MVNKDEMPKRLRVYRMWLEHPVRLLTFIEYYYKIS